MKPNGHGDQCLCCDDRRKKARESARRMRNRRKFAGLCVKCGRDMQTKITEGPGGSGGHSWQPGNHWTLCPTCRAKDRERRGEIEQLARLER
jgi:5-methylcytosine-specific restriction endonuclease McrA